MLLLRDAEGRRIGALDVVEVEQWAVMSALLNYIFGVGGQNAANARYARMQGLERSALGSVSTAWSRLDPVHDAS